MELSDNKKRIASRMLSDVNQKKRVEAIEAARATPENIQLARDRFNDDGDLDEQLLQDGNTLFTATVAKGNFFLIYIYNMCYIDILTLPGRARETRLLSIRLRERRQLDNRAIRSRFFFIWAAAEETVAAIGRAWVAVQEQEYGVDVCETMPIFKTPDAGDGGARTLGWGRKVRDIPGNGIEVNVRSIA